MQTRAKAKANCIIGTVILGQSGVFYGTVPRNPQACRLSGTHVPEDRLRSWWMGWMDDDALSCVLDLPAQFVGGSTVLRSDFSFFRKDLFS